MKRLLLPLLLGWFAVTDGLTARAADAPAPPPAAPAKRSAAELEKLVAPIALYPDALLATLLPASVYPLEIVQAARFVANTNNLPRLDEQPWDANVKAVARVPEVIQKLNSELSWTMELGEAFLAQEKDVTDAIQLLRSKARELGTLKTSPQQVVTVTNIIIEKTVEQKVVVVTNTVVQIQPANPQVIYVPTYNPAVVYYPPPPAYVGPPPVVSFAAGVAVGAIIANNVDWHHGGCYHHDVDIDIDRDVNINRDTRVNTARGTTTAGAGGPQKWQPDPGRLSKSGTPSASTTAQSRQNRGWGTGGTGASPATVGARPSTGTGPSAGTRPAATASPGRSATYQPSSGRTSSPSSAFTGADNGPRASAASSRGAASRQAAPQRGGGQGFRARR